MVMCASECALIGCCGRGAESWDPAAGCRLQGSENVQCGELATEAALFRQQQSVTSNPDHLIMKVLLTVFVLAAVAHANLHVNYKDPQDKCEFSGHSLQNG